ncbi:MAG: acetate kinase [Candidatus Izemoplasmatales bacterium]|nr:acetate kinase [Candidatus Izemoplasmatales bacterium]MDD4355083.1 acetate kinase [Candidatus Izemoplasmatales bacterium]MDD4988173.1 acetate kinase [Candidatus Izemoplasmatales bacterium]MDY0373622.1 acetate kinase [Candidatus Izemoplasmatales bacterium]NLF48586.1 acetate kinase [Acholeplasmataceae bacterium]
MAKIMAVNAGSSSLKFQLLEMPEEKVITSGIVERIGLKDSNFMIKLNGEKQEETVDIADHAVAVRMLLDKLINLGIIQSFDEIEGVGHRIVHGASVLTKSCIINEKEIALLESIIDLGPLHLGPNLTGIKAFKKVLPNIKHIGIFDTAFHQTMPEEAFMYAVPYDWYERFQVRKYGFHGTSHQYVSERVASLMGKKPIEVNVIVCHIGNGASICAVKQGKSVDTTMGFTPLEGIPMGTRSGNIDPAIIEYMMEKKGKSAKEITNILNKQSGYIGVSGISSDSRDLVRESEAGNHRAKLAIEIQAKRIADYIASYYVYMGGADAIVFTAGIGENAPSTRQNIIERIRVLGAEIDLKKNEVHGKEQLISTPESKIKVYVIPTNEEVMIARDTYQLCHL